MMDIFAPYKHFALYREPFRLTPHRDLFYPDQHEKVLDALEYAIRRGDGIVKVVGEVGTGKTLLCRLLFNRLEELSKQGPGFEAAYISAPRNDTDAIMTTVCHEFGLEVTPGGDATQILGPHLVDLYSQGKRAILIIDEAQALDRNGLETVRLMTNFETDEDKLLTIVLFGQPELDNLLRRHGMRQLAQRIAFNFTTRPFSRPSAIAYVQHRVDLCTDAPAPHRIYTPRALKEIAKASRGVPRLINILADRALIAAYGEKAYAIDSRHVRAAMKEGLAQPVEEPSLLSRLWQKCA